MWSSVMTYIKENKWVMVAVLVLLLLLAFAGREVKKSFEAVKHELDEARIEASEESATKRELAVDLQSARTELSQLKKDKSSSDDYVKEPVIVDGKLMGYKVTRLRRSQESEERLQQVSEEARAAVLAKEVAEARATYAESRVRELEQTIQAMKSVKGAGRTLEGMLGYGQGSPQGGLAYGQSLGPVVLGGWVHNPVPPDGASWRLDLAGGLKAGLRF